MELSKFYLIMKSFKSPKILSLILLVFAAFVLAGCLNKKATNSQKQENTQNQQQKEQQKEKEDKGKMNFGLGGKTYVCESENENGDKAKVTTDGENLRVVTTTATGKKQYFVKKGDVSYIWEEGNNKGIKIDTKCLEKFGEDAQSKFSVNEDFQDPKKFYEKIQGADNDDKIRCGVSTEKVNTNVPSNVNFIDQCELLEKIKENLPYNY